MCRSMSCAAEVTNFVGMTLNDGVNTVSVNSSCGAGAQAWVTTDANGNINAWYLDATGER